ncbi:MAG: glycosyltransferase family A protein, partial [Thermofilum sp.]
VGKAINAARAGENLAKYHYLLKLDADVKLHPESLERHVSLGADLVGLGPFMLIKMEKFLSILGGRWPETPCDDGYILYSFTSRGAVFHPFSPDSVAVKRRGGALGSWRYYYLRGADDFRIGINPVTELRITLKLVKKRGSLHPVFTYLGYLTALAKRKEFYSFASVVFRETLRSECEIWSKRIVKVAHAYKLVLSYTCNKA